MTKEIVHTDRAPSSPYYSQAVRAAGLVFVAGQGPFDPATGEVVGATIQEQTRQCLRNVEMVLQAAGSSLDRVVKVTVLIAKPELFGEMNAAYREVFAERKPARAVVRLGPEIPGVFLSIEATALA